jgi:hypothetical protein
VAKLTDYHAKYFAYELTRRCPSDSVERIASTLMDSQVDLNPHQVDAALFALRSPLSKGALLADEVGLGKTMEAGIVLAQKWAERKRKILLVLPSSLRKQWYQELQDKFYLPSRILESGSFNKAVKQGVANPFEADEIVICSYPFARNKAEFLRKVPWDLVVMDEAHRLRNVYKPGNKIANELKKALEHAPKLLLTATPLQNSLLELYGLVSFIDESIKSTRQKLLEHFDTEVAEKLKVYDAQSKEALSRYEALLWRMTRHLLAGQAEFDDEKLCFAYDSQRFSLKSIVNRQSEIVNGSHQYRLNHPLAQKLIKEAKEQELAPVEITFDYTGSGKNISILKPLVGKSGTLTAQFFSVSALEAEDYILFGALTDNGKQLDDEQCRRLFDLPGEPGVRALQKSQQSTKILEKKQKDLLGEISERNAVFFDEEMEKLEKWAEDRRVTLKVVLKEQDELIKELKKEARRAHSLPDKLGLQKKIRDLQKKRDEAWRSYDDAARTIEEQKDELIDKVEKQLKRNTFSKEIFTIRWGLS